MKPEELNLKVKEIVKKSTALKDKHTNTKKAKVNYACIFSQSNEEYEELLEVAKKIGKIIKETPTGPLFLVNIETISGNLRLLKIRAPDSTRTELGDADFTIPNFKEFEKNYLSKPGFRIIKRETFYMIELMDKNFNVRAYFSNPPLDVQLKIK
jgi:hypothetical protein